MADDGLFGELGYWAIAWTEVVVGLIKMLCVGACLVTLFCVVSVYLFSSLGGSVIFITRCGLVLLVVLIRMIDLTEGKKRAPEGKKEEVPFLLICVAFFEFLIALVHMSYREPWVAYAPYPAIVAMLIAKCLFFSSLDYALERRGITAPPPSFADRR